MRRKLTPLPVFVLMVLALVLTACGGTDGETATSPSGGGSVVDPQPPGQAVVSVDGQEFTLTEPGALACEIEPDTLTFSFRIGDNEVALGAGANLYDTGWIGSIDLRVANPESGPGPVSYFPSLADDGDGIAIDGDSMSYEGPMQMQPPNDGSNPPPVDAGKGTISVSCP